jgi:hypothetical protein
MWYAQDEQARGRWDDGQMQTWARAPMAGLISWTGLGTGSLT